MPTTEAARPVTGRLSVLVLNWRDTSNPEGGGSERYIEEIARRLVLDGHSVTVFCASHGHAPRQEVRRGVRFVRAGGKVGVYAAALAYVARHGRHYDIVVDVQNGVPFLSPLVRRGPVMVLVHHVHREQWHIVYSGAVARLGWWIESWLAPRVYQRSGYVTVSSSTKADLAALGVDPERVTVVHNGSDVSVTSVSTPRDRRHPRLLVISRLVPHKQVEHALDVVAALRDDVPGLTLDVVGEGWWRDHLEARVTMLGLDDDVRFHGFVSESTKTALIAGSDVLLLPSVKEGWGLVVIEAAHHGVPSVAYRSAGGVSESIAHGQTGILVDSVNEMVAAVRTLVTDPTTRDRFGVAARERARTFSWESTASGFEKALRASVEPRRPSPLRSRMWSRRSRRG